VRWKSQRFPTPRKQGTSNEQYQFSRRFVRSAKRRRQKARSRYRFDSRQREPWYLTSVPFLPREIITANVGGREEPLYSIAWKDLLRAKPRESPPESGTFVYLFQVSTLSGRPLLQQTERSQLSRHFSAGSCNLGVDGVPSREEAFKEQLSKFPSLGSSRRPSGPFVTPGAMKSRGWKKAREKGQQAFGVQRSLSHAEFR